MAARLGIDQGSVSRLELATRVPTLDLVTRYLDALGASEDVRQEILDELAEQRVEVALWRRLHRAGMRQHQQRYGGMERSAAAIREWNPHVVPGLLQTADYTRAMCRAQEIPGLSDVEGIVAGRIDRQEALRDRTKRFFFLLAETVLRTRDVPPEVMHEQLDSILLMSAASHIEVGVVPLDVLTPTGTTFLVLDDQTVLIELATRELAIHESDEVARYLDIFERLRARAMQGAHLAELIRRIASDLTDGKAGKAP